MIYGNIKSFEIVTAEQELAELSGSNLKGGLTNSHANYVMEKHQLAERHNRYVVMFSVQEDSKYRNKPPAQRICVFIPKGVIDNGLIERETFMLCAGGTCTLRIAGVEDSFDQASNGATQIHDLRTRTKAA